MVELLKMIDEENIKLFEDINFHNLGLSEMKGLYDDGRIYLGSSISSTVEKRCILAEELGHHFTAYGNIIDQGKVQNVKIENLGKKWAYELLVPLEFLIIASKQGIRSRFELAEQLSVTEKFLEDSISHYRSKYGTTHRLGRYIFYFEPFGVMELLED